MILEHKYRPGFIVYPTILKTSDDASYEFKICQSCGRSFIREIILDRIHRHTSECFDVRVTSFGNIYHQLKCRVREGQRDENGVIANVATKYCQRCSYVPEFVPKPPMQSEIEEHTNDEKLKWRRRGGDHSNRPQNREFKAKRMNWKALVPQIQAELERVGKMNSRQIGKFVHYRGSGAVAISNLERNGLSLVMVGDEVDSSGESWRRPAKVRIYALKK